MASSRLTSVFVGVPPQFVFPDAGFRQIGLLLDVENDDTGPNVGAADIDRQNRVMRLEHPGRRKMRRAQQSGFVRLVADRNQIDLDLVRFQNDGGAADRQFADTVARKPPPITMRSVPIQAFSFRKRRITSASSCA